MAVRSGCRAIEPFPAAGLAAGEVRQTRELRENLWQDTSGGRVRESADTPLPVSDSVRAGRPGRPDPDQAGFADV